MLYLCDVLQLVVDGLNDGPLAQQNLVLRTHEHVPHIVAHARDELYSVDEEHLEKGLADIAPVPAELAPDVMHVALVPERLAVVEIMPVHLPKCTPLTTSARQRATSFSSSTKRL